MRRFFHRLFCPHEKSEFIRNIHGDEIIHTGWMRSIWKCVCCGKILYSSLPKTTDTHEKAKNGGGE